VNSGRNAATVMMTENRIGLFDLGRGGEHAVQLIAHAAGLVDARPPRVMRQMPEDILHHDDGGVDDDAEVDGADRQQIGGFAAQDRDEHGQQQRHRNRRRDDQGAAQVARNSHWIRKISAMPNSMLCSTVLTVMPTRSPRRRTGRS